MLSPDIFHQIIDTEVVKTGPGVEQTGTIPCTKLKCQPSFAVLTIEADAASKSAVITEKKMAWKKN